MFETATEVAAVSPLLHPIDDMPMAQAVGDLMEFSRDNNDDLIKFDDTADAAMDLFGKLNLSDSFSLLYKLVDGFHIDDVLSALNAQNESAAAATIASYKCGEKVDDCDAPSWQDEIDYEKELALLSLDDISPLSIPKTDWDFEYKRIFGHLDNIKRRLSFD